MKAKTQNRHDARKLFCRACSVVALAVASNCASRVESRSSGNTNWLRPCNADGECGTTLSCVCGLCTIPCTGLSDCSSFGTSATCAPGRTVAANCATNLCMPANWDSGAGTGGNSGTGGAGVQSGGSSGSTAVGGNGGVLSADAAPPANQCAGACCPTDPSCYSTAAGTSAPGAECLAPHDNTGLNRIQMRQTWVRDTVPLGNTIPAVYNTKNQYANLNDPACLTPNATSGYIQAFDLDLQNGEARIGYSAYVTDTAAAKANGLCLVDGGSAGWTDRALYNGVLQDFSLPADQMSPSTNYPAGLPHPMPQPWTFGPTKAKRLDKDFDVNIDRVTLLKMFDATDPTSIALPQNGGFSGVFFYDAATAVLHAFSPLTWQVEYDPLPTGATVPPSFVLMPMREAEFRAQFNDPPHPDCIGRLRVEGLAPVNKCILDYSDPSKPPWLGWPGVDDTIGEGSANTHGYFLITELEQIFSPVLGSTLCVSFPTYQASQTAGWASGGDRRCRAPTNTKTWNPSDPVNGLPMGDWCAATNGPATADCHDAYRSISYHAFQGFKVSDATCAPL